MTRLSKHDVHKLFLQKAAHEVSQAELMAAHSILAEAIPLAFEHRKYGHLANVLTVNVSTEFNHETIRAVLRNLKEALEEVDNRFEQSFNGAGKRSEDAPEI